MAIQVYIGNLSPQTTQGAIRRLFQPYGYITSVHLMADNAGRPCGFAFVTMDTYGAGAGTVAACDSWSRSSRIWWRRNKKHSPIAAVQNVPGAFKRRLITRRIALSTDIIGRTPIQHTL
jgi:hypothetical protein